jgi:P-type conjugative transfer protein TrbJ
MKKKYIIIGISALTTMSASAFFGGGGSFTGAKEWTQLSNKAILGSELAKTTSIYSKQIQEYATQIQQFQTQLEQFDVEKIMAETFDTSIFEDTIGQVQNYQQAFDINKVEAKIENLKESGDFLSGGFDTDEFVAELERVTQTKIETVKSQSDLAVARKQSVEVDKSALQRLQNANSNASGAMQAAQIGNHIDSEILAQLIKMREESATESEIEAQEKAVELEEEEARKAWLEDQKKRSDQSLQLYKQSLRKSRY